MIGRGGSSKVKRAFIFVAMFQYFIFVVVFTITVFCWLIVLIFQVYQVLDHKKQLFAVKYVDLEEADAQTIESYKNEIEHLNHLQQFSDQIIKLYD